MLLLGAGRGTCNHGADGGIGLGSRAAASRSLQEGGRLLVVRHAADLSPKTLQKPLGRGRLQQPLGRGCPQRRRRLAREICGPLDYYTVGHGLVTSGNLQA